MVDADGNTCACRLHLDEQFLADKKNGLATSSLDPASMPMVVADTLLFMAHDSHRTDSMHSNPGSVMVTARDDNSMLVQQDQAAGAQSVKGSSETNLDPAKFEVNEFKADEYLSTDAEQDVDSDADEPAGASADLAEMQTPVENNIVPFLLARIAQVLQ